jgi:hypothetical protein
MYVHVYIQFTSGYVYMHIICTTCAIMYTCESHVHVRVYTSNAPDGLRLRFAYEGTSDCERGLFFAAGDVPGAGTFTGDAVATVVATVVALFSTSVVDAGATLSEVALFLECGDPLTHFAIVSFSFVKSTTPLK